MKLVLKRDFYVVLKIWKISYIIGEQVIWRGNLPIIVGNGAEFLRITGIYPPVEFLPYSLGIYLGFGTVYPSRTLTALSPTSQPEVVLHSVRL
jgi:hypothetical protein